MLSSVPFHGIQSVLWRASVLEPSWVDSGPRFSIFLLCDLGQFFYPLNTSLSLCVKSRDITLPTKVHIVKAMVFPVVMYGCEKWIIKKAECQRIDAFELWCWRRLLRVPWTARRSNQSVLKGNQSWIFTGRTDAKAETPNTLAIWCEELTH